MLRWQNSSSSTFRMLVVCERKCRKIMLSCSEISCLVLCFCGGSAPTYARIHFGDYFDRLRSFWECLKLEVNTPNKRRAPWLSGLDGPGIKSRGGAKFSAPVQTCPGTYPSSCTMGTGSFPGVKSGRGVTLTPHTFLMPWSRKGRATPLLSLWAVRPVQSLSACTRVHFTFTFTMTECIFSVYAFMQFP